MDKLKFLIEKLELMTKKKVVLKEAAPKSTGIQLSTMIDDYFVGHQNVPKKFITKEDIQTVTKYANKVNAVLGDDDEELEAMQKFDSVFEKAHTRFLKHLSPKIKIVDFEVDGREGENVMIINIIAPPEPKLIQFLSKLGYADPYRKT